MKNKLTSIVIIFFLITIGFFGFTTLESDVVRAGGIIYVGSGPNNDSATIGDGIVLAGPGGTVFIYSGVYIERLVINNAITLIGEDRDTTIIDGFGGKVVKIFNTDWVNITGFTITNGSTGFYITSSSNNTFKNNIVRDNIKEGYNNYGFFFSVCPYSNNEITGNLVYNNGGDGIHLEDESSLDKLTFWNNTIINNIVYNNTGDGIIIDQGTNNYIIDNIVHQNGLGGIRLDTSSNNVVKGNIAHDNDNGMILDHTVGSKPPINKNNITKNMVYYNNIGITVKDAQDNTFINNSIFDNNCSLQISSQSIGNNFINCSLEDATNNNVYLINSGNNYFINCRLINATINIMMKQQCGHNYFTNCSLSDASKDEFNLTDDSHAVLLNTTFNKTRVSYGDSLSSLTVKWFMHVKVIYWNGTPVSTAMIWVNDTFGGEIIAGPTDTNGWTRWIIITEYLEWFQVGERYYYTPHNVTASDGELWGYADPFMDISKVGLIVLGMPPPILPPTNLTTTVINNGNNIELEWDPSPSPALDHYLIYRADSATEFDFTEPYNISTTWSDPKNTTWIDNDPGATAVDGDFYYIVRAAIFNELDISLTSNTAGVWTRMFEAGTSTFSLPLEPFAMMDTEFYCQDMNASYIKWMNLTTHTWMYHEKGRPENITFLEVGKGYEIGFDDQTRYSFCGMPGAMIQYDEATFGFDTDPFTGNAKNITAVVDPLTRNVNITWEEAGGVVSSYQLYNSTKRDGFWRVLGKDYHMLGTVNSNTLWYAHEEAARPGTTQYYMVFPIDSIGERGISSYSIGVWTGNYDAGYDTFALPLKPNTTHSIDWYCNAIDDTWGINYYNYPEQRWMWHKTIMPEGIYDTDVVMCEGYQVSTTASTKFTFIGV